jgi:hypothetical protein
MQTRLCARDSGDTALEQSCLKLKRHFGRNNLSTVSKALFSYGRKNRVTSFHQPKNNILELKIRGVIITREYL